MSPHPYDGPEPELRDRELEDAIAEDALTERLLERRAFVDVPLLYEVGDDDPTWPTGGPGPGPCRAEDAEYLCTWPVGHEHPQHVAGTGTRVVHVWPVSGGAS